MTRALCFQGGFDDFIIASLSYFPLFIMWSLTIVSSWVVPKFEYQGKRITLSGRIEGWPNEAWHHQRAYINPPIPRILCVDYFKMRHLFRLFDANGRLYPSIKKLAPVQKEGWKTSFEGKLTSSKWAALTQCSHDTALRDIQDLLRRNILKKDEAGGRSTGYVMW